MYVPFCESWHTQLYHHDQDIQQSITSHKSLCPSTVNLLPSSSTPDLLSVAESHINGILKHSALWVWFLQCPEWSFQNINLSALLYLSLSPDRPCRVWPLPIVPAGLDRQDGWLLKLVYRITTWGLVNTTHSWVLDPETTDSVGKEGCRDLFFIQA